MAVIVPPPPSASLRSANMRANRRADTGPERRLRTLLHAQGLRFRVDFSVRVQGRRPIRPDIVFTRVCLAVFVDGCFWHGCPDHGSRPRINEHYWGPKIARNRERDSEQTEGLTAAGWLVLRFWEHEDPARAVAAIEKCRNQLLAR